MAVIGMIGPHAIGKTTAALRWAKRYGSRLTVAVADSQYEFTAGERVRVKEWKGSKDEKMEQARRHKQRKGVTLIESARGFSTWLSVFSKTDPVIVLTCSEQYGRWLIEERRRKNGNHKPLSDYWTKRRLEYECHDHLMNYVSKKLDPDQVYHFEMDCWENWGLVDMQFYDLFREVNNRRLREGLT